jgi:hypothetical protein
MNAHDKVDVSSAVNTAPFFEAMVATALLDLTTYSLDE